MRPIDQRTLVPWMPYEVLPIVIQRLPSGLSGPAGTTGGQLGLLGADRRGHVPGGVLALRADLELADQRADRPRRRSPPRRPPSARTREVVEAHLRHVDHEALRRRRPAARSASAAATTLPATGIQGSMLRVEALHGLEAEAVLEGDVEQRVVLADDHLARARRRAASAAAAAAFGCASRGRAAPPPQTSDEREEARAAHARQRSVVCCALLSLLVALACRRLRPAAAEPRRRPRRGRAASRSECAAAAALRAHRCASRSTRPRASSSRYCEGGASVHMTAAIGREPRGHKRRQRRPAHARGQLPHRRPARARTASTASSRSTTPRWPTPTRRSPRGASRARDHARIADAHARGLTAARRHAARRRHRHPRRGRALGRRLAAPRLDLRLRRRVATPISTSCARAPIEIGAEVEILP